MTVLSTNSRNTYTGGGTPSVGPYAYTYRIFKETDLFVTVRDLNGVEQTLTWPGDFSVTGVRNRTGGTISLAAKLQTGYILTIRRVPPLTQETDIRNQGQYYPETHEDAFDRATMVAQELAQEITASVRLPETIDPDVFDTRLPTTLVAGNAIVVNGAGTGFAMGTLSSATLSAWSASQNQRLDTYASGTDFTAGTTTVLTLSAAPGGNNNLIVTRRTSGSDFIYLSDEYSVSGATLTFTSAIPSGTTRVEVRYFYTYQVNISDAENVSYTPASGPITDVRTELRALDASVSDLEDATENLPNDIEGLHVKDFGVVGDGSADDTVALQAALDAGEAQHKVVYCGALLIKITAGVTMGGPGLVFDHVSFGSPGEPGIIVSGSGYTALTLTGVFLNQFRVTVYGTGNTANGIYFNNVTGSHIQKVRVWNLDGFGFKIDKMYDSTLLDISVEKCGNSSDYAFSVNAGDDTSNMSHIGRLQVEQANAKAILIEGSTLSCVFDNIHSERATAVSGVTTWDIGGTRCVYNGARFTALNPSDATIYFRGENSTFNSMAVEGACAIIFEALSLSTMVFNAPNFSDASGSIDLADHSGLIQIISGMLGTLNASAEVGRPLTLACYGTKITALDIGDVGNPSLPSLLVFQDCTIGALTSSSANSAATFDRCVIAEGNNLLEALTVLRGCTVTCASSMASHTGSAIIARDTTINGNVALVSSATLLGYNLRVHGNLSQALNCSSLLDSACYATGTVTGLGVPTKPPSVRALTDGVWRAGQWHHNLAPASGQPIGWGCSTGGGDGVFVFSSGPNYP